MDIHLEIREGGHRIQVWCPFSGALFVSGAKSASGAGRPEGVQMRYMLLIYESEERAGVVSQERMAELIAEHNAFTRECIERGVFVCAHPLRPTATATTIKVRGPERITFDGPFAETREQLGGYYQLDCRDLDEALEIARRVPVAVDGSIEVRPVIEMPGVHTEFRNQAGGDYAALTS